MEAPVTTNYPWFSAPFLGGSPTAILRTLLYAGEAYNCVLTGMTARAPVLPLCDGQIVTVQLSYHD